MESEYICPFCNNPLIKSDITEHCSCVVCKYKWALVDIIRNPTLFQGNKK